MFERNAWSRHCTSTRASQLSISAIMRVKETKTYNLFFILLFSCLFSQDTASQDLASRSDKNYFQSDVDAFIKEDSLNPPPQHSVEFIGSSIFRLWAKLKEQMDPLPVFNRAFGGSRTNDVLYFMDKIVFPYSPKIIIYYCGSNDAGGSVPVNTITSNIISFFQRVEARLPDTKTFFVSVNRSPARKAKWSAIDSTNAIIEEFCSQSPRRKFINVNPVLFDLKGKPRLDLYLDDQLHFKDDAYKEFTKIIKPILLQEWFQNK